MAYIIAVCGAGGKSSYIKKLANKYANENKRVVVTTTTHILNDTNYSKNKNIKLKGRVIEGGRNGMSKLTYPQDEEFKQYCNEADIVIVEADGAKHHSLKIPNMTEPVIPLDADEIVVIMGGHAVGRALKETCHRLHLLGDNKIKEEVFEISKGCVCPDNRNNYAKVSKLLKEKYNTEDLSEIIVDIDLLTLFANEFYIKPLSKTNPNAKIRLYISNVKEDFKLNNYKLCLVMTAAGYSRRFGSNKLLAKYKGKELYKHTFDNIIDAVELVKSRISSIAEIIADVYVVSQYDEILNDCKEWANPIYNANADKGMSESIKLSLNIARQNKYNAIAYFVADQPELDAESIAEFILDFLFSRKGIAVMKTDNHICNPAVLSEKYYDLIEKITGDRGCISVIKENLDDAFVYNIDENKLKDIDFESDLV